MRCDMNTYERQKHIEKIAEKDLIYRTWYQTFLESEAAFEAYAAEQPEEIRDILWNYAAGGRLMNQRLLNIACEYMDFIDPSLRK